MHTVGQMNATATHAVLQVPFWAYDLCYYYLALAVVVMVATVGGILSVIMAPGAMKSLLPTMGLVAWFVFTGLVSSVLAMMQFWICRSALKPQSRVLDAVAQAASAMRPSRGSGTQEGFAVQCSSLSDCTAVMGTPQPSGFCECGERGVCGGCTMQNNMVPSMLPAYSEPLAGGAGPL